MKYSLLEIRPTWKPRKNQNKFYANNYNDPTDRIRGKSFPNLMGFYHYPTFRGKKWAGQKLKEEMIKYRKNVIKQFERDIKEISKLVIE